MDASAEPLQPIFTAHLFPKLEGKLIELSRSLAPQDWETQTLAPQWKMKDVAAHLLDTQVRVKGNAELALHILKMISIVG
jgi:hypothetical protein